MSPRTTSLTAGASVWPSSTGRAATSLSAAFALMLAVACPARAVPVFQSAFADYAGHYPAAVIGDYDTIRNVKRHVHIPVIANGDITTPAQARAVLEHTGADAVMIGRGAQGAPWIFQAVNASLRQDASTATKNCGDQVLQEPLAPIILAHLESLYNFYGEHTGIRMARKHLGWYCQRLSLPPSARQELMGATDSAAQFACAQRWMTDEIGVG